MNWKKVALALLLVLVVMTVAACSKETQESPAQTEPKPAPVNEVVEIEFWHAMGGSLGEELNILVDDYNKSQDKVKVTAHYQGSYEELLTKFRTVGGTKNAPAVVQVFEVGTKYMIESGHITPVQDWVDRDNYDLSQLEENILSYYTVDGKLYSMPFNSSTPALFYNKDAFREVGLDPDNPPQTFNEITTVAALLTTSDRYGFSTIGHGWFFEQLLATQGANYVNENNGRTGDATEVLFNGPEGLKIFEWINDMHLAGTYGYFGRSWDDARAAFQAGQVAMYMDSSAATKALVENAPFDVGVTFIPYADDTERHGVIIGGASLWMANGISEAEQAAAWDFMKYLQTPSVQAKWHVNTGYFAINPQAYDDPLVQQEHEKYPQLRVPIDQLQATKKSTATQGALMTVFPEARQYVVTAFENMYQGMDPKAALNEAAELTNRALDIYHRTK